MIQIQDSDGSVVHCLIGLWQIGMEIKERLSDGFLIMWQLGSYSMWREVMEGGYLVGYRWEGEIDGYEDDLGDMRERLSYE